MCVFYLDGLQKETYNSSSSRRKETRQATLRGSDADVLE